MTFFLASTLSRKFDDVEGTIRKQSLGEYLKRIFCQVRRAAATRARNLQNKAPVHRKIGTVLQKAFNAARQAYQRARRTFVP